MVADKIYDISKVRSRIKNKSLKREKLLAKEISGYQHLRSGGLWWLRGDASNATFLFDDKFTENNRFYLCTKILSKIEHEAASIDKIPVLKIGFISFQKKVEYAVIPFHHIEDRIDSSESFSVKAVPKSGVILTLEKIEKSLIGNTGIILYFSSNKNRYALLRWHTFKDMCLSSHDAS